jgi:hypothetical protein
LSSLNPWNLSILGWSFGWTVDFEDASSSKKPAGVWRRRAFFNPAVGSGRSAQAIAVRRHVRPMMVVMTRMAVNLHLRNYAKQGASICQMCRAIA